MKLRIYNVVVAHCVLMVAGFVLGMEAVSIFPFLQLQMFLNLFGVDSVWKLSLVSCLSSLGAMCT